VLDGVTPAPDTPEIAGMDGAAAAVGMLRAALRGDDGALRAAESVARFLRRPGIDARSQPQACAVICDLSPGRPSIVRLGDCEAWVRVLDAWRPVLTGSCLTEAVDARLSEWQRAHPTATLEEVIRADAVLSADPASFVTAPVGRLAELRPEWGTLGEFDELVLASDGARLDPERLRDIDGWLTTMRRAPPDLTAKPFDDVTVARVRPSTSESRVRPRRSERRARSRPGRRAAAGRWRAP
jgi:hypothetical protein